MTWHVLAFWHGFGTTEDDKKEKKIVGKYRFFTEKSKKNNNFSSCIENQYKWFFLIA